MHSEKARGWFEQSRGEKFFFCRFTQVTVLRLLTTEKIMGNDVTGMSEAWGLWDKIWADPQVAFLAEPEGLEREFRVFSQLTSRSPKVWADAYILAFAACTGTKLVTFDKALVARGPDVLLL